jgi:uncharacterized OB-fold protein
VLKYRPIRKLAWFFKNRDPEIRVMKCPTCGRRAGWVRTRCPACKTKLITWYIIAAFIIVGACWGGLVILEKVG